MFENVNKKINTDDANNILDKLEAQIGNIPEREQMIRMVTTFENPKMALHVVNYIITFLNKDTLRGYINYNEFVYLYKNAIKGLYKLMFLDLLDERAPSQQWESYRARMTASFTSASQLIYYMMTRISEGREYDLKKLEIEVKQQKNISIMGGNQ